MEKILKELNDEQRGPVLDVDGAVLVTAGAGSGKTRVLTSRIAYLIKEKKVYPYNILAITFTNKAAAQMQERLVGLVENAQDIWICTIHKMCVKILRRSGHLIGYNSRFTIYTDTERERIIKKLFKDFEIENDKAWRNIKFHIDRAKMLGQDVQTYCLNNKDAQFIDLTEKIYTAYENELKSANALDFDDLLIKTYELLAFSKQALDEYSSKFRYIHVDEFQDTNTLQYQIIKMLASKHGNIFAVGDDDQSIYGWRGACIENILHFERDFPAAKLYKLEKNYRSTKNILDAANYVIKNNNVRRAKRLWTENASGDEVGFYEGGDELEEAAYTANLIYNKIASGAKPSDFAVLMRLNALSRVYEQAFLRYNVATKIYGGQKFFDRKEVKDLTAYLRLINNPSDNDAFLRIINVPKRGIGEKTLQSIVEIARHYNITLYDVLLDIEKQNISKGAMQKLIEFKTIMTNLVVESQTNNIFNLVKKVIEQTNFLSMFEAPGQDNENRKYNINEFLSSVAEFEKAYKDASLAEYLNSISLNSDGDEELNVDSVTLATIHAVKGLEFKTVFICGLDEGIMPIARTGMTEQDLEEERRLMYVAITRARKNLYLTRAQSRFLYGERKPTNRSCFLLELAGVAGIKAKDYTRSNGYGAQNSGASSSSYNGTYMSNSRAYSSERQVDFSPSKSIGGANLLGAFNTNRTNTKPNSQKADVAGFVPGSIVMHAKFGEGTIITIKGAGERAIADIAFVNREYGIKQLALAVAPLKLIK